MGIVCRDDSGCSPIQVVVTVARFHSTPSGCWSLATVVERERSEQSRPGDRCSLPDQRVGTLENPREVRYLDVKIKTIAGVRSPGEAPRGKMDH